MPDERGPQREERQHEGERTRPYPEGDREDVDADRIGIWGTSFSGGHVQVIASEDERIAAAVSQGSFGDGLATLAGFGLRDSCNRACSR